MPNVIQDEGVNLPARTTLNFTGAGVTASDDGARTVVTVPGAAGGSQTPWTSHIDGAGFELRNPSRIGIGTSAPGTPLHLHGPTNSAITMSRHWASDTDTRASAVFHTYLGDKDIWAVGVAGDGGTQAQPAQTSQIKMAILANGYVGIGLTDPYQKLHVNGDIAFGPPTRMATFFNVVDGASDSGAMVFSTRLFGTLAERVRIAANGSVGIGTAPDSKLTLNAGAVGTTAGNAAELTRLYAISGNTIALRIAEERFAAGNDWTTTETRIQRSVDGSPMGFISFRADTVILGHGATDQVVKLANGNVGIGTASPTSKLHVAGLPSYADNAAAVAGGLTAGAFYHTGGVVKVVI